VEDSPHITPLTGDDFDDLVTRSESPVLVYITRKCCHLTNLAHREFVKVAFDFVDSVPIYEVDAEREKALVSRLNVKAAPILLMFTSGIERAALLGFYCEEELRKWVWSILYNRS
jgi:thioredoxin-like negative regulator of GroEL